MSAVRVTRLTFGYPSVLCSLPGSGPVARAGRAGPAIPPHMLGIAGPDDADFAAMLAFGSSVIRLADIARHSGRAADAVSELWPLITRLGTRVAAGHAEAETMRLLAQARVSFGVALGHLLPEERLATAARWTGRALRIAWNLGDRDLEVLFNTFKPSGGGPASSRFWLCHRPGAVAMACAAATD